MDGSQVVRFAKLDDSKAIEGLIGGRKNELIEQYGSFDVVDTIDNSMLSLALVDDSGVVIAFAALDDSPPNIKKDFQLEPQQWEAWFASRFVQRGNDDLKPDTLLWLRLYVADALYDIKGIEIILKEVLFIMRDTSGIMYLQKRDSTYSPKMNLFVPLETSKPSGNAREMFESDHILKAFDVNCCRPKRLQPSLTLTIARVEDFDDLEPLFKSQSAALVKTFGEFFLAEVIEAQNEYNRSWIASIEGKTVGLMSVTTEIGIEALDECFDLNEYDGFNKTSLDAPEQASITEDPANDKKRKPDGNNVVCITLFCVAQQVQVSGRIFLQTILEAFPKRDYILLSLPHDRINSIPILEHCFVQVPLRAGKSFVHVLLLAHRGSIQARLSARQCTSEDIGLLPQFLRGSKNIDSVVACMKDAVQAIQPRNNALESKSVSMETRIPVSIMVLADEEPIGLVQFTTLDKKGVAKLKKDFNVAAIEGFENCCNIACASTLIINPLFKPNRASILAIVLRQAHVRVTKLTFAFTSEISVPDTIVDMFRGPVPRRWIPYQQYDPEGDSSLEAMYVLAKSQLNKLNFRANIFARIVFVGASETTLSAISSMISIHNEQRFSNLYLLNPKGLPLGISQHSEPQFLPWSMRFGRKEMQNLAIDTRIKVVDGLMKDIDVERRLILLEDGSILPYDIVVLAPGLQSQTTQTLTYDREGTNDVHGVFSLSNEQDVVQLLTYLAEKGEPPIVVHGVGLRALQIISGLLEIGVDGDNIIWVVDEMDESEDYDGWCDHDGVMQQTVLDKLHEFGVLQIRSLELVQVVSSSSGRVQGVVFKENVDSSIPHTLDHILLQGRVENTRVLRCHVLLCCSRLSISPELYRVVDKNPFVFNGGIVVDSNFQTVDPYIYAAGPLAVFSKRIKTRDSQLRRLNSAETGEMIAGVLKARFMGMDVPGSQSSAPKTFKRPASISCLLPGNITYIESQLPQEKGDRRPVDRVLSTNQDGRITKLKLDRSGIIIGFVFMGIASKPIDHLVSLVGMPKTILNELPKRLQEGQVSDISVFLSEPWAAALYHDGMPLLLKETGQKLLNSEFASTIINSLIGRAGSSTLSAEEIDDILRNEDHGSSSYKDIQSALIRFIQRNEDHLPSYLFRDSPTH